METYSVRERELAFGEAQMYTNRSESPAVLLWHRGYGIYIFTDDPEFETTFPGTDLVELFTPEE